jgi:hypothetical protein
MTYRQGDTPAESVVVCILFFSKLHWDWQMSDKNCLGKISGSFQREFDNKKHLDSDICDRIRTFGASRAGEITWNKMSKIQTFCQD